MNESSSNGNIEQDKENIVEQTHNFTDEDIRELANMMAVYLKKEVRRSAN